MSEGYPFDTKILIHSGCIWRIRRTSTSHYPGGSHWGSERTQQSHDASGRTRYFCV